jgi:hypothetical protein
MKYSRVVAVAAASAAFGGGMGSLLTAAAESSARPVAKAARSSACDQFASNVGKGFKIAGTAIIDEGGYAALIEPAAKAGIADSSSQLDAVAGKEDAITTKIDALTVEFKSLETDVYSTEAKCLG